MISLICYAGMFGKLETVVQVKNQAYNVLSANHGKQHYDMIAYTLIFVMLLYVLAVIIGKQQTTVDLSENPAYDLATPMGQPKSKTRRPDSIASSAGKRQLEHTYESLSAHYAYPFHKAQLKRGVAS